MKIVAVAACTSGIAHTYIAKKKRMPTHILIHSRDELKGNSIALLEQMRTIDKVRLIKKIGELTPEEIKAADVVILAIDIAITGTERFEGKRTVKVPTNVCVKAPKQLLQKIEAELNK